jgi:hypothetical protein
MTITAPTDIAGCELWLDASDAGSFTYSSGVLASQWNDLSGNARHFTQPTVGNQPSRNGTQNGLDTVVCAISDYMDSAAVITAATANITIFVAGKHTGTVDTAGIFWNGSSGNGYSINPRANGPNVGLLLDGVGWLGSTVADPQSPVIYTLRRDATTWEMWLDRTQLSIPSNTTSPATPTTRARVSHSGEFAGEIYEVIFYSGALSAADRTDVWNYLTAKWSVAAIPPVEFTAIGAKTTTGTTTVSIAHPAGTAADQVLLAGRVGWYSDITLSDESGWTNTGRQAGGNNGALADNHTTEVGVDRKEISGADAGPTVFDQVGGTQPGIVGIMASYTKNPSSATWDFATSAGTDDTHGANRSVTGGTSIPLAVGDVVTAWVAVGTDASLTITSPAITASGITFGPTTQRAPVSAGSIQGHDGNIYLFDATVTAGSGTAAPVLNFTTATSQSGPVQFVRLRAVPAVNAPFGGSFTRRRSGILVPHLARRSL